MRYLDEHSRADPERVVWRRRGGIIDRVRPGLSSTDRRHVALVYDSTGSLGSGCGVRPVAAATQRASSSMSDGRVPMIR